MGENSNNNGKKGKGTQSNRTGMIFCLIVALIMVMMFFYMMNQIEDSTNQAVSYDVFLEMLEGGKVSEVKVDSDSGRIIIIPKKDSQALSDFKITYYTGILEDGNKIQERCEAAGVTYARVTVDKTNSVLQSILSYIVMFAVIYGVMFLVFRMLSRSGGGMMGVGKSNAKVYVEKETGVTFKDVAGQEEAKESLTEMVDFLHNPGKYTRIGAKLPKGALLVGPPGTGKTLLAKAVAGEAKVPFFSLSGSDFVEMFVGVGASRVRDLFKQAQAQAPCIIFIDEVDAIGKSRDSHYGGGNDEREQTLNQLLSEMDGFDTSKGLVILAATNRPEVLDKALLRPGRFDRRIIVDKPDLKGRIDILKVHAKHVLMHDSVNLEEIAMATSGAVGSDLANIINEAAILAVKQGRTVVTQADLFESVEVVIAGKEKKDCILGKEEKQIVAYHEVGHALIACLDKNAEPVQKITIVPRTMGALGYVMQVPEEEKYLMKKDELLARLVTLCGGRAAEELVFGKVTTGAANDIEKATSLARAMITQYGMSERFGLIGLESVQNRYLDGRPVQNCADETAALVDNEVMELLKSCYDKAYKQLSENREVLDKIAEFLVEKETITGKEFMKIYREIKGIPEPEEEKKEDDKEKEQKDSDEMKHSLETDGYAAAEENVTEEPQPDGHAETSEDMKKEEGDSVSH
ncbi:MAG: ATP-dependent zinc metalloprotease FtsH [Lachnospiraceae bacterium]|nr:ATP-dependent zinc metalloprotease FtsH [Lachnospiraceae bacterium]